MLLRWFRFVPRAFSLFRLYATNQPSPQLRSRQIPSLLSCVVFRWHWRTLFCLVSQLFRAETNCFPDLVSRLLYCISSSTRVRRLSPDQNEQTSTRLKFDVFADNNAHDIKTDRTLLETADKGLSDRSLLNNLFTVCSLPVLFKKN